MIADCLSCLVSCLAGHALYDVVSHYRHAKGCASHGPDASPGKYILDIENANDRLRARVAELEGQSRVL